MYTGIIIKSSTISLHYNALVAAVRGEPTVRETLTPERWAQINFPGVTNVHTHHIIWYSINWNAPSSQPSLRGDILLY